MVRVLIRQPISTLHVHHQLGKNEEATKIMFIFCAILSYVLSTTGCYSTTPLNQQDTIDDKQHTIEWQAASFRGLKVGTSTHADMLSVLGAPKLEEHYDEGTLTSGTSYYYDVGDEIQGELVIAIDKNSNVIRYIELRPRDLSKDQVVKLFGNNYKLTKYEFDDCLGDGESSPLFESSIGSVTRIEYRSRGIAIAVNESNKVEFISYVSEPVGAPSSKCK